MSTPAPPELELDQTLLARALRHRSRPLLLWLVVFAVYAAGAGLHATPGSDLRPSEARTLLTTQSLVHDGDFELRDDYANASWRPFYDGALTPTALTVDGRLVEPQGLAFPVLLAPAYAAGGRIAVELLLAAIAALLVLILAALARIVVPEPWATRTALAVAVSPPAVLGATTIDPAMTASVLIAAAALLALRTRSHGIGRAAASAALLLALVPWLAPAAILPALIVAAALYRWARRSLRGWSLLGTTEILVLSAVVWVTVDRHVFGGWTPAAASTRPHAPTGIGDLGDAIDRLPRLLGVWIDPQIGVLLYAPVIALAIVSGRYLLRLRGDRPLRALVLAEDAAAALRLQALVFAAVSVVALLTPSLDGRSPGEPLLVALPALGVLAAAAMRRMPRLGTILTVVGFALSAWLLVAVRLDDGAGVAPVRGAVPWSVVAGDDPPGLR